eukprot:PhM_4_TR18691/c3_g1_i1/m.98769
MSLPLREETKCKTPDCSNVVARPHEYCHDRCCRASSPSHNPPPEHSSGQRVASSKLSEEESRSESQQSVRSSQSSEASAFKDVCALYIVRFLLSKSNVPVVWFHPGESASRTVANTDALKDEIWKIFPRANDDPKQDRHSFWECYCGQSDKIVEHPEYLLQKEFKYDFFGYVDLNPDKKPPPPKSARDRFVRKRDPSREDSPDKEYRKAVIFEVTLGEYVEYEVAKMELRLAVFLAKRRIKLGDTDQRLKITDVVAHAGVCIPDWFVNRIKSLLEEDPAPEFLPLTMELHKAGRFHILSPPASETLVSGGLSSNFWCQLLSHSEDPTKASTTTVFKINLTTSQDIDALKDAVLAKLPELKEVSPLSLTVYAHDAATGSWKEAEVDSPLVANNTKTAYHVYVKPSHDVHPPPVAVTSPFWCQLLSHGEDPTKASSNTAFAVTPTFHDIDGLKKAVLAELPEL